MDLTRSWPQMIGIDLLQLPTRWKYFISISSALIEILIGIFLLFSIQLRIVSITVALLHLGILVAIGPWGSNRFHGIWLWNIFCALISPLLFYNFNTISYAYMMDELKFGNFLICFFWFLFGFAPLLSYVSLWNPQWSFQMHSCNFPEMYGYSLLTFSLFHSSMKVGDVDDSMELEVYKYYFVRKFGDIDLFAISQEYHLTPTTSVNSSAIWAQSLANFLRVNVIMKVESRPAVFSGETIDTTRVFEPMIRERWLFLWL